MKKFLAAALCAVLTGCGTGEAVQTVTCPAETAETEQTSQNSGTAAEPVQISGYFAEDFLKYQTESGGNFVISPYSVKIALNMAAIGAEEGSGTQRELLQLFGYESTEDMLADCSARPDGVNNSAWVSDSMDGLKKDYKKNLDNYFGAEFFFADLSDRKFVTELNGWVDRNTGGMIPTLLDEPLSEDARLALVNTVYFKNKWAVQFDPNYTYDEEFYGTNGTVKVPTMHNTFYMDYGEGEKLRSAALGYEDGSEMRIYLPLDESADIADVIAAMSPEELHSELDMTYGSRNVSISLPKFECERKGSLTAMLRQFGVRDAFDPAAARFGGISDDVLFISEVIQAAKIRCDEEGTVAAAATMETMAGASPGIPDEFKVNKPFVYEILSPEKEILFMGYIENL